MVRRLPARAVGRIANSALQVGVQTCTRVLAFREIQGDLHFSNLKNDSLLQVGDLMAEDYTINRPGR
jgi:hypothetical protein